MIEARSILLLWAGNTLLLLAIIFRVWVSIRGTIRSLQRENAELILRLDAIDAGAITAGVTLRDVRERMQNLEEQEELARLARVSAFEAQQRFEQTVITADDMSVFIETAMKAVHDRLLLLERAREDNKGPVQARGVVASRRAIMEMGGAKDLM